MPKVVDPLKIKKRKRQKRISEKQRYVRLFLEDDLWFEQTRLETGRTETEHLRELVHQARLGQESNELASDASMWAVQRVQRKTAQYAMKPLVEDVRALIERLDYYMERTLDENILLKKQITSIAEVLKGMFVFERQTFRHTLIVRALMNFYIFEWFVGMKRRNDPKFNPEDFRKEYEGVRSRVQDRSAEEADKDEEMEEIVLRLTERLRKFSHPEQNQ
jgi:hypothetical protein